MTYEDLLKSSEWIKNVNSSYFASSGARVLVFKLDKKNTKLNPIYNEEIDGRKYLRPFEIKSVYKTNPFNFSIDTIPTETEGSMSFTFEFNGMVQLINALKSSTSKFRISTTEKGWSITKRGNSDKGFEIILFHKTFGDLVYNLNEYETISSIADSLTATHHFICDYNIDDYAECIPNFKETIISNNIDLKTFNRGFADVKELVEEGDLIYTPATNALYEVTSAYPVNNSLYNYVNWQCNAQRTFAYVNYEALKAYKFGFNFDENQIQHYETNNDVSIKTNVFNYDIATDSQIRDIIDSYKD